MAESLRPLFGTWPADDLRRAFVAGAKWWEYEKTGATMWQSDQRRAEAAAEQKYPGGQAHPAWMVDLEPPPEADHDPA